MTSKRSPGPILAVIGGAAVLGAIVWGLIAVGGPGDARALRLDEMRLNAMRSMAGAATCAYIVSGKAPETIDAAKQAIADGLKSSPPTDCDYMSSGLADDIPVDVSYSAVGDNQIDLCADFVRPSPPRPNPYTGAMFMEFNETRAEAGPHCYRLTLSGKSESASESGSVVVTTP